MDLWHYHIKEVSKRPPLAVIQSLNRFLEFSAMRRSFPRDSVALSANNCFNDFKSFLDLSPGPAIRNRLNIVVHRLGSGEYGGRSADVMNPRK